MKISRLTLTGLFVAALFTVIGISNIVNFNTTNSVSNAADIIYITPYPTGPLYITPTPTPYISATKSTFVHITYTCKNDIKHYSYITRSSTYCRSSADLLKEANSLCYANTAGSCALNTLMSNCVDTYNFSGACAAPRLSPTPSITYITSVPCALPTAPYCPYGKLVQSTEPQTPGVCPPKYICVNTSITVTPTRVPTLSACVVYRPYDYNQDGVINSIDYQIFISKYPAGTTVCPVSPYPTAQVSCNPLVCPQPPLGCSYYGGNNCTTCGEIVCRAL